MFGGAAQGDLTDVRYYEEDTRRIFAEYRSSPSFVMFALGNEERIGFYYYEEFLKFCKRLEPDLLCSDIAGHSTYPTPADFASKWIVPGYLPLAEPCTDWDYSKAVRSAPIPITGHEVGQLQIYPDYDSELPAYDGVLKPRNLEQFQAVLAQAGLAQAGLAGRAADFHRATGPEEFRRSCCELAVLARLPKFVWEGGEMLTAEILVSNYSPAPAELALAWTLEDGGGRVLAQGKFLARTVPQGGVAEAALARGARVVIISEGTSSALPYSRAVAFRPDFWSPMFHTNHPDGYTLGIFVDKDHPLFADFPTEDFGDWQWFEPLQNARGLLINRLPAELRPIVQPIASIDLPDRLALLFEARVGPGRLLVSSVDLFGKDGPASRWLLAAIYRYVDSGDFQPEAALEPGALRPCLPPLDLTRISLRGKVSLAKGERIQYKIEYFDSRGPCKKPAGKTVELRSGNPSILRIDGAGRAQCLPQWLELTLSEEREMCALLCGGWRESTRGAILRAALSISLDGERFDLVCRREWGEDAAEEDKLFAFPPRRVRILRLTVDWAVMHTGDSNAVSVSQLAALPDSITVTLADGSIKPADVVWLTGAYSPDIPGDYIVEGILFCRTAANPGNIRARQILRVLPKDMTTPPDKTELDRLTIELKRLSGGIKDPARREQVDGLLTQVESFAALTGAVQHDVDVWAERVAQEIDMLPLK